MPQESTALELVPPGVTDLVVSRAPELVLAEAQRAAKALTDVLAKRARPVFFNGERYLEFEDWQTIGRFYGVTHEIVRTDFVDYDYGEEHIRGWSATAVALRADGYKLSSAEAVCLTDEPKWRTRRTRNGVEPVPLFMLKSMAQTRAGSRVLRNVLAWVVVLAGFKPTPAEEMDDDVVDERESVRDIRDDAPRGRAQSSPPPRASAATSSPPFDPAVAAAAARSSVSRSASSSAGEPPSSHPEGTAAKTTGQNGPSAIGTIVDTNNVDSGGVLVRLSTGFVAGTRHPDLVTAVRAIRQSGARVELITQAPTKAGRVPTIIELRSVDDVVIDREPGAEG